MPIKTATLKVPGADLYYEVRGAGPVLVMMPGGPADAWVFRDIAGILASNYTVVTYDPRGLSHSKLESPLDKELIVQVFADDVHRLLAAVAGKEKGFAFASSGGATISLELAARHPEQLDTLVVHEPPSPSLQPDPDRVWAGMKEVVETYRKGDAGDAMQKFAALIRLRGQGPPPAPDGEPAPEAREARAQMQRNMDLSHRLTRLGRRLAIWSGRRTLTAKSDQSRELLHGVPCFALAVGFDDLFHTCPHAVGIGLQRWRGRLMYDQCVELLGMASRELEADGRAAAARKHGSLLLAGDGRQQPVNVIRENLDDLLLVERALELAVRQAAGGIR